MVERKLASQSPVFALVPAPCGWRAIVVPGRGDPLVREGASFAEAVAAGRALGEQSAGAARAVSIAVALPARLAVFARLTLPAAEAGEMAAMVRLQFEKNLPYPIEETACGFHVLSPGGEGGTPVLAYAVAGRAVEALCAPLPEGRIPVRVTLWAAHVAACAPEGQTVCGLWREEGAPVFGIFENRRLSHIEPLPENADPLAALPGMLLRAEVAGASVVFDAIVLDGTFSALGDALSRQLSAPVTSLPEGAAPPAWSEAEDLAPPAWRARAERQARSRRLWKRGVAAVAVYAAAWIVAAVFLGIEEGRVAAARKEAAALQPKVDAALAREARYRALAPAFEPARTGVELLFRTWQCLPSAETRITRLELTPDQIAVEGEAPNARQAIAFGEALKARPELADYRFDAGRPALLPNEHAQFRIFGKR